MPTIGISTERLRALVTRGLPPGAGPELARIEELLDQLGCDVDGVGELRRYKSRFSEQQIELGPADSLPLTDPLSGESRENPAELWELVAQEEVIKLDLLPVRPDLFDAGGLARALRGYLGIETGLKDYKAALHSSGGGRPAVGEAEWRVEVDPRITDPRYGRPHVQCAIVRGLSIDESLLRAVMKLQESIHWALCRDRKFASLGCYDLAALKGPVRYTLTAPGFRFRPLLWGSREAVTPDEMLAGHPKGQAYQHLVEGLDAYPLLIDAAGQVLSLPPVINADESKVVSGTRDLFLDATGPSLPVVERALAILATSLVELDESGAAWIEPVRVVYPDRELLTPALQTTETALDPDWACRLLGLTLTRAEVAARLERMRHGVADSGSGPFVVTSAAYRHDIIHAVDLVEDLAIAHGYHNFRPALVPTFTAGRARPENLLARQAASVLTGLGFTETLSLVLTSEDDHYEKLLRPAPALRVRVANPVSVEQTMLREHLYSSLLKVLGGNTDHPLPQRIFEVGDVVGYGRTGNRELGTGTLKEGASGGGSLPPIDPVPDKERRLDAAATGTGVDPAPTERRVIAGAVCATRAGYAEGRSVLDALLIELAFSGPGGEGVEYRADENPSGLPGRSAVVYDSAGARSAELFEVHPQVLENFGIPNPVVLFSLQLGVLEH